MSNHPSQVTLNHFVMVRIHARQVVLNQRLTLFTENAGISILAIFFNFRLVEVKLVYDFGSQACMFEPCRVQSESQEPMWHEPEMCSREHKCRVSVAREES